MAAWQTCKTVGMPGCRAQLAKTVAYLAEAPKSTRAYEGYNRAEKLAKRDPTLSVPLAMRDVPVGVVEALECGDGYKYPPDYRCVRLLYSSRYGMLMRGWLSYIVRHPVTNEYLPRQLHGEGILRREGDLGDRLWDEEALRRWEEVENGGQEWVGRPHSRTEVSTMT